MDTKQMTYQEIANVLEELGITHIPTETIQQLEDSWRSTPSEITEHIDKTADLLTHIGRGSYDYATYTWTPTSHQVYSFDMEVDDIGQMYTLFLQGISAISNGEFEITDIVEDTSKVNYEDGTGTQIIHFNCNGNPYTFEATVDYDWFDVNMIDFMNQVLKKEKLSKQLFSTGDGYQECIIFFCTKDWAARFSDKTGCDLSNE